MNMDTINLLVNAGIAGVFAVFALMLTKEFTRHQEARDALWREFLNDLREQNSRALGRLADEIKDTRDVLIQHDSRTREYITEERARKQKTAEKDKKHRKP